MLLCISLNFMKYYKGLSVITSFPYSFITFQMEVWCVCLSSGLHVWLHRSVVHWECTQSVIHLSDTVCFPVGAVTNKATICKGFYFTKWVASSADASRHHKLPMLSTVAAPFGFPTSGVGVCFWTSSLPFVSFSSYLEGFKVYCYGGLRW